MSGIFISYRREIDAGWAGRLADNLKRNLPDRPLFHDIASIEIGEDFGIAIKQALGNSAVLLVVIGPHWLDVQHPLGGRRLDDKGDWVRFEILNGLQGNLRVVPVLVGGAVMPKSNQLPDALEPLVCRNAHEITDKRWDYDVGMLVEALRKIPAHASGKCNAVPASQTTPPRIVTGAMPAPGTLFRHAPDFPELVVVPAGRFQMGSSDDENGRNADEGPRHEVIIARPFAVGRYPVTFAEWDTFIAAGGTTHKPDDEGWGRGRQPVIHVSWKEAQAYVAWLRDRTGQPYHLLSEAEWEYAARAGTTTRYPWGDEPGLNKANFNGSGSPCSNRRTSPVGNFAANAFGLHDMIGNVWEWVQDAWHDNYLDAPNDGQAWEEGRRQRVVRGGSWFFESDGCRAASRLRLDPDRHSYGLGFRVCCALSIEPLNPESRI